jgi:hypothetical protein
MLRVSPSERIKADSLATRLRDLWSRCRINHEYAMAPSPRVYLPGGKATEDHISKHAPDGKNIAEAGTGAIDPDTQVAPISPRRKTGPIRTYSESRREFRRSMPVRDSRQ